MPQRHNCFKVNIYPSHSTGSSKQDKFSSPAACSVPQWQEGQVTREINAVIKPERQKGSYIQLSEIADDNVGKALRGN